MPISASDASVIDGRIKSALAVARHTQISTFVAPILETVDLAKLREDLCKSIMKENYDAWNACSPMLSEHHYTNELVISSKYINTKLKGTKLPIPSAEAVGDDVEGVLYASTNNWQSETTMRLISDVSSEVDKVVIAMKKLDNINKYYGVLTVAAKALLDSSKSLVDVTAVAPRLLNALGLNHMLKKFQPPTKTRVRDAYAGFGKAMHYRQMINTSAGKSAVRVRVALSSIIDALTIDVTMAGLIETPKEYIDITQEGCDITLRIAAKSERFPHMGVSMLWTPEGTFGLMNDGNEQRCDTFENCEGEGHV